MKVEEKNRKIPLPKGILESVKVRVQEHIYGHRFTVDQEPYMILLEALTVCNEIPLGTEKATSSCHEELKYELKSKKKMRFLLFHDHHLTRIANDGQIPENEKWKKWKQAINQQYDLNYKDGDKDQFSYLDHAFNRSIESFSQAISILRSQEIDVSNDRRPTSKFLAVKGPDTICNDFKGDWSRGRLFFARGGELVYLMLNRNRSVPVECLNEQITQRFLDSKNSINRIAEKISDSEKQNTKQRIGYLPLIHHEIYDQMADDWMNILTTPNLLDSHIFDPLFRITGLNLITYFASRAQEILERSPSAPIVADLTGGADRQLQNSAKAHLSFHRTLANRAVGAYMRKAIEKKKKWKKAVRYNRSDLACKAIKKKFLTEKYSNDGVDLEQQILDAVNVATSRPKYNLHALLLPLTKGIGIVESRGPTRTWFSLSDEMLEALVIANVHNSDTCELRDFTKDLYRKYKIVIGPEEARLAFANNLPVGSQHFQENLAIFERRMTHLSLTIRHSDDCAFVINPYRGEESE